MLLNLNAGTGTQVLCKTTSHPLKELRRHAGELGFSYEAEVLSRSTRDFFFSYSVCSSDISGRLLLQSPSLHDVDQREMFCFYLFPGSDNSRKVFKKAVIFVLDISASMQGGPLENTKIALLEALSKLNPIDSFNIIASNDNIALFSSSMELATNEAIENATEWISTKLIPNGGTNMALPLNQVHTVIIIFYKCLHKLGGDIMMLHMTLLYPFHIQDLSTRSPLILSGRYHGKFPDSVKASGMLADLSSFMVDVKVQKAKDFPLDMVLARRHIDALTSHAWLSGSKQLEEKVAKISTQAGIPSEYTGVILVQTDKGKQASESVLVQEMIGLNGHKIIFLSNLGVGFGSLTATAKNFPPGSGEPKLHESKEFIMKAASNYCGRLVDCCCCLCCIQALPLRVLSVSTVVVSSLIHASNAADI